MSLGGGGGSPVQAPPVPPPVAIPDVAPETEDIAKKKRPRGRQETFLTGNLVPITDKKKVLG